MADDDTFRRWWDLAGNRAQSPREARAAVDVIAVADVRDTLGRITAPTLILHREGAVMIPPQFGRYLAEHISGSRYVELPGADTLHWTGDAAPILDEIEEFVTGVRGFGAERVLTTIVFTDIVGSTARAAELGDLRWHDLLDNHDRIVRHELERFRGREVNTAGDGFVATFTSPSVAIDCADAIVDAVRGRSASRYGWAFMPARSRCGVPTSRAWRCTSVRGSRTRGAERGAGFLYGARDRHRVTRRSPSAANTTSRVCPADGGSTRWPATESARRSERTPDPCRRRTCGGSPMASRR